jgi:hypothetical protein
MAVDTTVTAITSVTLTAGTLSDIDACVVEVGDKLSRGTLSSTTTPTSSQVQRWLIRAKEELCEVFGFHWARSYGYFTTVAADYIYGLGGAYEIHSLRDTTNDKLIRLVTRHQFDTKYPDPSAETSDKPALACLKGYELWFIPPPDGAYKIEVEYSREGHDSTTTDISYIPEVARFRMCDFALAEAYEYLDNFDRAAYWRQKWDVGVAKHRRASGRKKWAKAGYQCMSWQQEYAARYNQS